METDQEIDFEIPSWAGKPQAGLHLDVLKGDKLIQKLMIDEKRCYFVGRNPTQCDIMIDHASCSRVHAVLLYHKHLGRMFLLDLGSTHGTFIGKVRLESKKPEQLLADQVFHFGASTRRYVLREKPKSFDESAVLGMVSFNESSDKSGLPEKEDELDNLTEYNTALNRRIGSLSVVPEDPFKQSIPQRKRRSQSSNAVQFTDEEEIINPEDVDPNVGRFRNLVQTAVIPAKKARLEDIFSTETDIHRVPAHYTHHMTSGGGSDIASGGPSLPSFGPVSLKLGLAMPNLAPDVDDMYANLPQPVGHKISAGGSGTSGSAAMEVDQGPRKKKYAKEAWPGKKPTIGGGGSGQSLLT